DEAQVALESGDYQLHPEGFEPPVLTNDRINPSPAAKAPDSEDDDGTPAARGEPAPAAESDPPAEPGAQPPAPSAEAEAVRIEAISEVLLYAGAATIESIREVLLYAG